LLIREARIYLSRNKSFKRGYRGVGGKYSSSNWNPCWRSYHKVALPVKQNFQSF